MHRRCMSDLNCLLCFIDVAILRKAPAWVWNLLRVTEAKRLSLGKVLFVFRSVDVRKTGDLNFHFCSTSENPFVGALILFEGIYQ